MPVEMGAEGAEDLAVEAEGGILESVSSEACPDGFPERWPGAVLLKGEEGFRRYGRGTSLGV
jgi:hypothetical protein